MEKPLTKQPKFFIILAVCLGLTLTGIFYYLQGGQAPPLTPPISSSSSNQNLSKTPQQIELDRFGGGTLFYLVFQYGEGTSREVWNSWFKKLKITDPKILNYISTEEVDCALALKKKPAIPSTCVVMEGRIVLRNFNSEEIAALQPIPDGVVLEGYVTYLGNPIWYQDLNELSTLITSIFKGDSETIARAGNKPLGLKTIPQQKLAVLASQEPKPLEEVYIYLLWPVEEEYDATPWDEWLKALVGPEGRYNIPEITNDCGESERGEEGPTCLEIEAWLVPREFSPKEAEKMMEFPYLEDFMYVSFIEYKQLDREFYKLGELPGLISSLTGNYSATNEKEMVVIYLDLIPGPTGDIQEVIHWVENETGHKALVSWKRKDCQPGGTTPECLEIVARISTRHIGWRDKEKKPAPKISFNSGMINYQGKERVLKYLDSLPRELLSLAREEYKNSLMEPSIP